MKILVVNLLRLGDVIAAAPALKAIRGRYPQAEIHLMVNGGFESAARRIANVDRVIRFERDRLQASCVEADRPMFEAYDWLTNFVDEVSSENYDLMFNFTHNRLSGWLCGLIAAQKKIGLVLDGSGAVSFGSAWFRHLNQQVDFDDAQSFNHTDIFIGAVGGWEQVEKVDFFDGLLLESTMGREEARDILGGATSSRVERKVVALQLSTSDAKKEWGDDRFRALTEIILRRSPTAEIFVLGSPDEKARVDAFVRSCEVDPGRVRPAILSLAGLVSFLEAADVLVTGDTSIKHFGAAATVRVVEIIVGSADAHRTGSWKAGDVLITSRELCAPCGHTELCHRSTHACAIAIQPESVAHITTSILNGEDSTIRRAQLQNEKYIHVFEADRSEGTVSLLPQTDAGLTDQSLALCLERSARRLGLETRDANFDRFDVGSEILATKQLLSNRFPGTSAIELRHALADGEMRLRHAEGIVQSLKIQLARLKESFQDVNRMREMISSIFAMRSRLQKNPWTRFVAEPLVHVVEDDRSAPFTRFRKLADAIQDLELRIELALKLIRGLELEFGNENTPKNSMGDRV